MQGVTVSWVGQSFALPRCSASRENKSRIRRTKEERKTMIMSFIKKYQSSNNGKFPSLNLTHKEVGGSFYTIREIVREIIQENKVLGPGNPSSKLLNLQYYSEEADNGSFLDVHGSISISAIGNGIIDHVLNKDDSSMEQQEVSIEENIASSKPGGQVKFKTDLNENFSRQVKNGGSVLHEKLVNTGTNDSNIHSITAKKDDVWGSDQQINTEVQPNILEDIGIQYAKQSFSLYPTVPGTFLVESKLKNEEDKHNKLSVSTHCFEESANILDNSVTESLPETSMGFTQSNCGAGLDNNEVLTLVDDKIDRDGCLETVVRAASNTPQISRYAHRVHLPSEPFVKGTAIYSSELETVSSNGENDSNSSLANKTDVPFIPFSKEPFTSVQLREIALSSERGIIDVAEGKSVDSFVLQTTRSPAPGAMENDIQLVDKSSSVVDAVKESENASIKLLEPAIQTADHSDFKSEEQSDAFSASNDGGFMSSSNEEVTKESDMLETNPFWAAIKAFVSSFFKFWSE